MVKETEINPLSYSRRHPSIFTDDEAAAYLGLESTRSLETLRKEYGLKGHRPAGRAMLYHKKDLDDCADRMFGKDLEPAGASRRGKP